MISDDDGISLRCGLIGLMGIKEKPGCDVRHNSSSSVLIEFRYTACVALGLSVFQMNFFHVDTKSPDIIQILSDNLKKKTCRLLKAYSKRISRDMVKRVLSFLKKNKVTLKLQMQL